MALVAFLLYILPSLPLMAQAESSVETQFECFMDDTNLPHCQTPYYTQSVSQEYLDSFEPVVFNIFFWGINEDDGANPPTFTEEHVLMNIAKLNMEYNQYNIFFKLKGWDNTSYTSTARYTNSSVLAIWFTALSNGWYDPQAFNFYVPYSFDMGSGQALTYGSTVAGTHHWSFQDPARTTILHEIAHNFDIYHTRYQFAHASGCERVTRDPADPNYNANTNGDCGITTAAVPEMQVGDVDLDECRYIGEGQDCGGNDYEIFEPDVRNIMGSRSAGCYDRFTVGQAIRMREYIGADPDAIFGPVTTTLAALYEPYKGEYIEYASDPNNDPPLFQPGFEYYFWECECQEQTPCIDPAPYEDTSFSYTNTSVLHIQKDESDYSSITHPNHTAIAIKHPHADFWPQPRKCFDNWQTPPIIGGTITLFRDGVFNSNVTITPQDSLQMNDSNLIPNLDPGLYTIKKNKGDGSVEETNILKEND
ncbi:MAG: hypothetical protein KTR22_05125 [Flavobacteriaceae bacterium]|nr:hypothetical protein [Flavobacteriaceae bacterium]